MTFWWWLKIWLDYPKSKILISSFSNKCLLNHILIKYWHVLDLNQHSQFGPLVISSWPCCIWWIINIGKLNWIWIDSCPLEILTHETIHVKNVHNPWNQTCKQCTQPLKHKWCKGEMLFYNIPRNQTCICKYKEE